MQGGQATWLQRRVLCTATTDGSSNQAVYDTLPATARGCNATDEAFFSGYRFCMFFSFEHALQVADNVLFLDSRSVNPGCRKPTENQRQSFLLLDAKNYS